MFRNFTLLSFLAAGLMASVAAAEEAGGKAVIAKMGDIEIRVDEVRGWLAGLDETQREAAKTQPALLTEAVRTLLVQRLVLQEADAKKWAERPEVAAKIERQRSSIVSESYLRSMAEPEKGFPSEDDLRKAYDGAGDALNVPRRLKLAQIFIAAPADAKDKAAKEAQVAAVKKKLAAAGADFAAIAKSDSQESTTAEKGGELGWVAESQIQPEIREEAAKVAKNAVTAPVQLKDGWHFVKVLDREEPRKLTLEEVKPRLQAKLREQRIQAGSQAYLAKLLKEHPVVINEIELPKVLGGKSAE
jgi:peptidylprolyl isomerase